MAVHKTRAFLPLAAKILLAAALIQPIMFLLDIAVVWPILGGKSLRQWLWYSCFLAGLGAIMLSLAVPAVVHMPFGSRLHLFLQVAGGLFFAPAYVFVAFWILATYVFP